MKPAFTGFIAAVAFGFLLAAGLLAALLAYSKPEKAVVLGVLLFAAAAGLLMAGFMYGFRSRMLGVLHALSELVQDLADGRSEASVPFYEDSLPSKLQNQIIRLSRRMDAERSRYRQESREIKTLISDISHQLKTPMANLAMYAGLLRDDSLPEEKRREFTLHMAGQTEKLGWLTESLIKLSRLESGIIQLKSEHYSLGNTVLAAIRQVFPQAESRGLEIRLEGERGIMLRHDPRWTAEAIYNIIDNAVKYSGSPGSIVITLTRYDLFARVDISDSGCGIPEEELPAVFQRFYRGAGARDTEGAGIGLYLSRRIIADQGGYIKAASQPGKGSRFSVFLPLSP